MPADYGTDFAGVMDITPTLRGVEGPRCVIENIASRLVSPRGCLWYDPAYGFDVRQFLSGHVQDTGSIVAGVVEQAESDERVDSAEASVSFIGDALTISLSLTLSEGTFEYTLTVDKVTGKLLLSEATV
jgi:hypothetical protein